MAEQKDEIAKNLFKEYALIVQIPFQCPMGMAIYFSSNQDNWKVKKENRLVFNNGDLWKNELQKVGPFGLPFLKTFEYDNAELEYKYCYANFDDPEGNPIYWEPCNNRKIYLHNQEQKFYKNYRGDIVSRKITYVEDIWGFPLITQKGNQRYEVILKVNDSTK